MILAASLASCGIPGREPIAPPGVPTLVTASWYGRELAGNRTASGTPFDPGALTAAHRTLPFGTRLVVRNPQNGATVVVTVNDRGPWRRDRDLDLSAAAARKLGILNRGVARLEMRVVAGDPDAAALR